MLCFSIQFRTFLPDDILRGTIEPASSPAAPPTVHDDLILIIGGMRQHREDMSFAHASLGSCVMQVASFSYFYIHVVWC